MSSARETTRGASRRYEWFVATFPTPIQPLQSNAFRDREYAPYFPPCGCGHRGDLSVFKITSYKNISNPSSTASEPSQSTPADVVPSSLAVGRGRTGRAEGHPAIELQDLPRVSAQRAANQRSLRRDTKRIQQLQELEKLDEMKFSHSIQFNAVSEWSPNYISYSNLKKLIFNLEKSINQGPPTQDQESSPLITAGEDPDIVYARALDAELEKICSFYQVKELEIYGEVTAVLKDAENYEADADGVDFDTHDAVTSSRSNIKSRARQGSIFKNFGFASRPRRTSTLSASIDDIEEDSDDDDADETAALTQSRSGKSRSKTWDPNLNHFADDLRSSRELPARGRRASTAFDDFNESTSVLYDSGLTLKKRTISLYVSLCELKSFIQLNKTGFTKALKKYDKVLDRHLKSPYIEKNVGPAYPFQKSTLQHVQENIDKIEHVYSDIVTNGDIGEAKRELRLHLREHVVWERNTVWREMIGIERKAQAANLGIRRTLLGGDQDPSKSRLQGDEHDDFGTKEVRTPVGKIRLPKWILSSTFYTLVAIVAVFFILLKIPILQREEQQNCLAMLVFVSLLWATEVIPLFVTSLLIPFLVVTLRVVRTDEKPHRRLDSKEAASYTFAAMWTPVIMLLLGGFAIAAALSKYHIAKMIATFVLSKAGTRPRMVLITNMFVAMIASMWIMQPMLRNLPSDSEFSKALILGIALAANIGGMASPIASPQNIIALQNMHLGPSWGAWFFISLPVCVSSILLIWVLLLITFQPGKGTTIVPIRPMKDKFTGVQWFISFVTVGTIGLWCVTHQLEGLFGDMGVVAIIPLVLFFGTGILTKEDFNNFLWTIIILAAGGLSLGKAVSSSGLLHTIAHIIIAKVEGMSLYGVLVVFCTLILVVATFISHTVAALIILPLVQQVGTAMDEPHPNLLVMGSALMCSAAMGLPTSGFPNMTAIMMEDSQTGVRYLRVKHFLTRGIPSSVLTFSVVISLGYGLMLIVGF
ncbi:MAG: low-affinity phosphate transporter [Vezdaea aestivalis]|nr:MAG: low-affinity phosphate transporter [Vezdaea aestivalis]